MSDANRALADASVAPDTPRPGWRYKATLSYRPGVAQAAFFRALKVGPRVAALVGRVGVDLEEVPTARDAPSNIRGDGDEGVSLEELATRDGIPGRAEYDGSDDAGSDDDDDFEHLSVCRRATLAEFYTLIRPALAQIAVNNVPRSVHLTPVSRAPRANDGNGDGDGDGEDEACSICMDAAIDHDHPMRARFLRRVLRAVAALPIQGLSTVPPASRAPRGRVRARATRGAGGGRGRRSRSRNRRGGAGHGHRVAPRETGVAADRERAEEEGVGGVDDTQTDGGALERERGLAIVAEPSPSYPGAPINLDNQNKFTQVAPLEIKFVNHELVKVSMNTCADDVEKRSRVKYTRKVTSPHS